MRSNIEIDKFVIFEENIIVIGIKKLSIMLSILLFKYFKGRKLGARK